MGSQLCPGSAKEIIQELGEIQKGERSYEAFFKSCFDFKEHKIHEILVNDDDQSFFMNLQHFQEAARPHFLQKVPSCASLQSQQNIQNALQAPLPEDATVELEFEDGSRYKGHVKDGLPHGQGEEFSPQGDHYVGTFNSGVKQGQGIYEFVNSEKYEGEFKENAMWGKGVYRFANGDIFEGNFRKNEQFGKGKYIFHKQNGEGLEHFEGQYRNSLKDGGGILKYHSFEMKGQWKNGLYEFSLDKSLLK